MARVLTGRSLASVRKAASPLGPSVIPAPLDITSRISVEAAFHVASQAVDHLDVLINNAGILDHDEGSIFELQAERLRRMFETNTIGALLVSQTFLPLLRKSQSGRIINVSTGSGQLSDMGTWAPAYSISKTALNGVTGQLAAALARLEHRGQFRLPRVGQDRHGRPRRAAFGRTRRGHDRVARDRGAAVHDRLVHQRPQTHPLVTGTQQLLNGRLFPYHALYDSYGLASGRWTEHFDGYTTMWYYYIVGFYRVCRVHDGFVPL